MMRSVGLGSQKDVHYYPVKLRNGIDGSGTAILNYPGYDVVLNVGKTANSYLPGEVYGLKETIVMDNAAELQKVELVDATGNGTMLSVDPAKIQCWLKQKLLERFYEIRIHCKNKQLQQEWLAVAVEVNHVLYKLRQSAGLAFPADEVDY